ncbi:MAG: hypothetical protein OK404_00195 [Thaumarchaeota archaeon]|nr:hypothetical protein [Nitrososphaerota archaeon]
MTSAPAPTAGSVSRIECIASIRGKGDAKLAVFRHLAPLTVNAILRSLPIDSRVNLQPAMACLFTELRIGVEKPRVQFSRGEVAFLASGGLICFFLGDAKSDRPLNPIGKVEKGLGIFDSMRPGEVVRLSASPRSQEPTVST